MITEGGGIVNNDCRRPVLALHLYDKQEFNELLCS